VEKPLALTAEEVQRVTEAIEQTGNDRLMVGFNRRFAPLLAGLRTRFGQEGSATALRYLVNAGSLGADSWYQNAELEGTRFAGEGGHFIDTLSWWAGSLPAEVYAAGGPEHDDVLATIRFENGSAGTISYVTGGNNRFPKETLDATAGGRNARLDNFRQGAVWAGRKHTTLRSRGGQDKGQKAMLAAFVNAVVTGGPMPISVDSLVATTRATIAVEESLTSGGPERL
jgi:predicted dehydrogenase